MYIYMSVQDQSNSYPNDNCIDICVYKHLVTQFTWYHVIRREKFSDCVVERLNTKYQ